jgi:hypothetical protein
MPKKRNHSNYNRKRRTSLRKKCAACDCAKNSQVIVKEAIVTTVRIAVAAAFGLLLDRLR